MIYMAVREDSVSATNCLFTLTSPRGRRLSHMRGRQKRYVLPWRINSTLLTNDLSQENLLTPKEKFFHLHHFRPALRASQRGKRRVGVLYKLIVCSPGSDWELMRRHPPYLGLPPDEYLSTASIISTLEAFHRRF